MSRTWKTNISILVAAFLIFTIGYFLPGGDNLTAIAMRALLLVASIYVLGVWVKRWSRGENPRRLDSWRRRFRRFASDEDDEATTRLKPDSTSNSK